MIVKSFEITSRAKETLHLLTRYPDQGARFPVVLIIQGIGMDMHESNYYHDNIADFLIHKGFVTVQFDFSYQKKVTKDFDYEIGLAKRAEELSHVIAWTNRNAGLRPEANRNLCHVVWCLNGTPYKPYKSYKHPIALSGWGDRFSAETVYPAIHRPRR